MAENEINLRHVLDFLDELGKHNNKAWFDQNRPAYEKSRQAFEQFVNILLDEFRASDHLKDLTAKECIARINRDIRFSKDKSPYRTDMWASVQPGGRKGTRLGYHISIGPHGHSIVAGGLYMPEPEKLNRFRQAIARDASEFKRITRAKAFIEHFGKIEGEKLKTAPQGYDRSHPEIELLQFKQVTVVHHFPDQEVKSRGFTDQVITTCRAMKPFLDYLNGILE